MKQSIDGLLVLDKAAGMTSRAAVNLAMSWFPRGSRIGHTGTLDPLATGVLVLCLGRATRLAEYVQDMDKCYQATIVLGARSNTDDADGAIIPTLGALPADEAQIRQHLDKMVGWIEQSPPDYSAVKVAGKRAHLLARKGRSLSLPTRHVRVDRISILSFAWPKLRVEIHCGKGTYIRSIARDLGDQLGAGAYVAELRRTRIGPFVVESAVPANASAEDARRQVLPLDAAVVGLRRIDLDDRQVEIVSNGQSVAIGSPPAEVPAVCSLYDINNRLVGLGDLQADGVLRPNKIFKQVPTNAAKSNG